MSAGTIAFCLLSLGAFMQSAAIRVHGPSDLSANMFGMGCFAAIAAALIHWLEKRKP